MRRKFPGKHTATEWARLYGHSKLAKNLLGAQTLEG